MISKLPRFLNSIKPGYSIIESLFALLMIGFFINYFIDSYAVAVHQINEIEAKSLLVSQINSITNSINSSTIIDIASSNNNTFNNQSVYSLLIREDSVLIPNTVNIESQTDCENYSRSTSSSINPKGFIWCYSIYITKIENSNDLYCFNIKGNVYVDNKLLTQNINLLHLAKVNFIKGPSQLQTHSDLQSSSCI